MSLPSTVAGGDAAAAPQLLLHATHLHNQRPLGLEVAILGEKLGRALVHGGGGDDDDGAAGLAFRRPRPRKGWTQAASAGVQRLQ